MTDSVLRRDDGAVATITINRPAARNALTAETKVALLQPCAGAAATTRSGRSSSPAAGQAFCSGQDLSEHAELLAAAQTAGHRPRALQPHIETIAAMPKPVIAALPGVAAGAGASMAFACDFRVAAERASFLLAFARVGSGPTRGRPGPCSG